jgi:hypothetical protein
MEGTMYVIKKSDFMQLKQSEDAWLKVMEKVVDKELRRRGEFIVRDNRFRVKP